MRGLPQAQHTSVAASLTGTTWASHPSSLQPLLVGCTCRVVMLEIFKNQTDKQRNKYLSSTTRRLEAGRPARLFILIPLGNSHRLVIKKVNKEEKKSPFRDSGTARFWNRERARRTNRRSSNPSWTSSIRCPGTSGICAPTPAHREKTPKRQRKNLSAWLGGTGQLRKNKVRRKIHELHAQQWPWPLQTG